MIFFLCFLCFGAQGFAVTKNLDKQIQDIIKEITSEIILIQEDIHRYPELAFQEKRTSELVAEYLKKLDLEVETGFGKTGVLGILRGEKPGAVIGMRADMDALPITEETGLTYASQVKVSMQGREVGVMHACGHDVHTAILLGVANVLSRLKKYLPGTVLFIAQPAEEWGDGANEMLKDGIFQELKPQALFAFHVDDSKKVGHVAYTPGYAGANCDGFELIIKSKGGHGSNPSSCVDPIVVGAQVVVALQVMVSREIHVHNDTVITVGSFHAGAASNVIPQKAELRATIRTYGEDQRKMVREKVERLIENICEAAGARFELNYYIGTPALYNDPDLLKRILPTVERALGGKEFLSEARPEMGGEDFSYFAKEVPSVMLGLGVVPEKGEISSVHSPTFIAEQSSIPIGIRTMAMILSDYLLTLAPRK